MCLVQMIRLKLAIIKSVKSAALHIICSCFILKNPNLSLFIEAIRTDIYVDLRKVAGKLTM